MKKEHFEVLLENMTGKIDLVLESHDGLNKKIDNVQVSLDAHIQENKEDQRLILQRINDVDKKVDKVDKKVDNLDRKVDNLDRKNETAHTALSKKLDARQKETSDIKRRVSRLEAARA